MKLSRKKDTVSVAPAAAANASAGAARDPRRTLVAAVLWLLLLVVALGAVTLAWFSSSRYTNVTPVAHTVSDSGTELLIGPTESGPFDTSCELANADKTLYPISTADLSSFWRASFQNASGITTDYADCTANVGDFALTGSFYLKGSSTPFDVYLYQSQMSVSSDPQLLAALRVGFVVHSASGTQTRIFACDDLGSTSGAVARRTTAEEGVVVTGSGSWSYTPDPALPISGYTMDGEGNAPTSRAGAQALCTLAADEVARVDYFVYMEGCDENCIDETQSRDLSLAFAFAAQKA